MTTRLLRQRELGGTPRAGMAQYTHYRTLLMGDSATPFDAAATPSWLDVDQETSRLKKGHGAVVTSVQWYPWDTGMFVSSALDGLVKLWDANVEAVAAEWEFCEEDEGAQVFAAHMSPSLQTPVIAVGTGSCEVRLVDLRTCKAVQALQGNTDSVLRVHWAPGNEWLVASGSASGLILLWDVRTPGILRALDSTSTPGSRPSASRLGPGASRGRQRVSGVVSHPSPVVSLLFSPDSCFIYSGDSTGLVRRWSAITGANTLTNFAGLPRPPLPRLPLQIGISGDGTVLYHPAESSVASYDVVSGEQFKLLRGHIKPVTCCCSSLHSQTMFSGSYDSHIIRWTADKRERPPPAPSSSLAWD